MCSTCLPSLKGFLTLNLSNWLDIEAVNQTYLLPIHSYGVATSRGQLAARRRLDRPNPSTSHVQ